MKDEKKKDKKMKKTRGKLQFSIFWLIIAPLEAKMVKHYENNDKKNDLNKNWRKIAIFHFFAEFLHHWKQKWWNMKKKKIKHIKKMKKLEENCNLSFFAEFLHHWKQKWWNMKKHD